MCQDHIQTDSGSASILRYSYYNDSLADEDQFAGFVPRWYVPSLTVAAGKDLDVNATQTLGIIDTAYEIKVGVGYDWAPDILKRG